MDACHHGTLWPSHVGAFVHIVISAPQDDGVIICIYLVLPMGWVESPKFFCDFLETLTDVSKYLVNTDLYAPAYGAITKSPATGSSPPPPLHA